MASGNGNMPPPIATVPPPLIKGPLYRSSDVVENIVNKRVGAIVGSNFVTYRRENDPKPTKVWSLKGCTLGPIKQTEVAIRQRGTSTLGAVIRGKHQKATLFGFKLHFKTADPLTIYFEEESQALSWRSTLGSVITSLNEGGNYSGLAPVTPSTPTAQDGIKFGVPTGVSESGVEVGDRAAAAPTSLPASSSRTPKRRVTRRWASLMHYNGVAVFLEELGHDQDGGAMMVSAVVRAPPRAVFEAFAHSDSVGEYFSGTEGVLQRLDDNRDVIRRVVQPGGLTGKLAAPREFVTQRTWRQDDDGTYIILFQSVEHKDAPMPTRGWFDWRTPVRMQIKAAGLTIAPLQPRYIVNEESPESLLTVVMNVEIGGWLSSNSIIGWLLGRGSVGLALMDPFIMQIVHLKDRVEQERFVIQPLEFGDDDYLETRTTLDVLDQSWRQKSLLQARMVQFREELPEEVEEEGGAGAVGLKGPVQAQPSRLRQWIGGTCPDKYWSCPGPAGFNLRGSNYLKDKKKIPAGPPHFCLAAVDLIRTKDKSYHIAPHLPSIKFSDAPFTLIVNMMIPGPPYLSLIFSFAADFDPEAQLDSKMSDAASAMTGAESETEGEGMSAVDVALARFLAGDDASRNNYFKLIPKVVQGSWIIKQSVGTTPVILGRKLTTTYHRGHLDETSHYIEIDVDIGSSSAAATVVGMVQGATKSLVVDMAILLEGIKQDELPESLLGTVRFTHLDLAEYKYLDVETDAVYTPDQAPPEVLAWK